MTTPDRGQPRITERVPDAADLLAAYELGLLDDAAAARMERALAEDPRLLEELYAGAPAAVALRDEPDRWHALLSPTARDGMAAVVSGWRRRIAAVTAVLVPVTVACLLLLAARIHPPAPGVTALARPEPLPYTSLMVRGGAGPADSLFAAAMTAYRDRRYGRTAALLGRAAAAAPADWERADQAALYRGVSLLLSGHPRRARTVLAEAARSSLPPVAQRARWYLAQAALQIGDVAAARRELERLRSSPVYGTRAGMLLERLP